MAFRLSFLLLLNYLFFPLLGYGQSAPDYAQKYSALATDIKAILKQTKVVGVSVAIIDNYQLAWADGFGPREVGTKDSITTETLFQAASITKSLAAVYAMHQVQAGRLTLDQDVNKYLTSWKIPYKTPAENTKITLKHLLSHTAGISEVKYEPYCPTEKVPELVALLNGQTKGNTTPVATVYAPGKMYAYSRAGYGILQQILTDTGIEEFSKLIEQTILAPLHMQNSTFDLVLPNRKYTAVATGHLKPDEIIDCRYYNAQPLAAGGLWSTPSDLAKFLVELQLSLKGKSNQILNEENTRLMLQPAAPAKQYALGFMLEKRGTGVRFFGHEGHHYGYISSMLASMNNGFGLVIMTNSENGWKAVNKIKTLVGRNYWGF